MGKKSRIKSKQWLTSAPSIVCGAGSDPLVVQRLESDEIMHTWEFGKVLTALQKTTRGQTLYNDLHPLITHNVRNPIMQLVACFLGNEYRSGVNAISGAAEHKANSLESITMYRLIHEKFKEECAFNAAAQLPVPITPEAGEACMAALYVWLGFLRVPFGIEEMGGPPGQAWDWALTGQTIWEKAHAVK